MNEKPIVVCQNKFIEEDGFCPACGKNHRIYEPREVVDARSLSDHVQIASRCKPFSIHTDGKLWWQFSLEEDAVS